MRSFYSRVASGSDEDRGAAFTILPSRARVAIYESPACAPRVVAVEPAPVDEYLETLSTTIHRAARDLGGDLPYTVVREVTENFIHAGFAEPVVSILDGGRTIRFADQGPGFPQGTRALEPGFTTATEHMKSYIRGVGSGLPIVRDYLDLSGGSILIEDNLGSGAVITISTRSNDSRRSHQEPKAADDRSFSLLDLQGASEHRPSFSLTTRQKQALALVLENGSAGPSLVSKELGIGISTAYRDLASLEELGLISADGGKRRLTPEGMAYLDGLSAGV